MIVNLKKIISQNKEVKRVRIIGYIPVDSSDYLSLELEVTFVDNTITYITVIL